MKVVTIPRLRHQKHGCADSVRQSPRRQSRPPHDAEALAGYEHSQRQFGQVDMLKQCQTLQKTENTETEVEKSKFRAFRCAKA